MSDQPILKAIQGLRAELTQTRVDLLARMDRLKDGLTASRGDIAVNR